jgi:hypothetical protein
MDGLPKFANVQNERPRLQEATFEIGVNGMGLDLLRAVYRNSSVDLSIRMRAAALCLPYETPKLAVTALITDTDFGMLLDRRLENLKRIEEKQNGKLIENQNGKLIEAQPAQTEVEVKAPTPSINFRSLRRRI